MTDIRDCSIQNPFLLSSIFLGTVCNSCFVYGFKLRYLLATLEISYCPTVSTGDLMYAICFYLSCWTLCHIFFNLQPRSKHIPRHIALFSIPWFLVVTRQILDRVQHYLQLGIDQQHYAEYHCLLPLNSSSLLFLKGRTFLKYVLIFTARLEIIILGVLLE